MLFKCFVERSSRSGRGKIVNVSKDGLNDQYAFVANASLWDSYNKCKPAFFAAVNVGKYYNALDSLIAYAGTLQEGNCTPESWAAFSAALTSAEAARDQNYSSTVSADTALTEAFVSLEAAIDGLVIVSVAGDGGYPKAFTLSQNYPNPFNPTTKISWQLAVGSNIQLRIYSILGEEVTTVIDERQEAGYHSAVWDGRDDNGNEVASGIYIYQLSVTSPTGTSDNFVSTRLMVLMR